MHGSLLIANAPKIQFTERGPQDQLNCQIGPSITPNKLFKTTPSGRNYLSSMGGGDVKWKEPTIIIIIELPNLCWPTSSVWLMRVAASALQPIFCLQPICGQRWSSEGFRYAEEYLLPFHSPFSRLTKWQGWNLLGWKDFCPTVLH